MSKTYKTYWRVQSPNHPMTYEGYATTDDMRIGWFNVGYSCLVVARVQGIKRARIVARALNKVKAVDPYP